MRGWSLTCMVVDGVAGRDRPDAHPVTRVAVDVMRPGVPALQRGDDIDLVVVPVKAQQIGDIVLNDPCGPADILRVV